MNMKLIDLPGDAVPYFGLPATMFLALLRSYKKRLEECNDVIIQDILEEINLIEIAKLRFDETASTRVVMLAMQQVIESTKPITERAEWVKHVTEFSSKVQAYLYTAENLKDLNIALNARYRLSFVNEILAQRFPGIEFRNDRNAIFIPKMVVKAAMIGVGLIEPKRAPLDLSELQKPIPLPEKPLVPVLPLDETEQEIAGLVKQLITREHEMDHFTLKRKIDSIMQVAIDWESFNKIISALKTCGIITWDGNIISLPDKDRKA